jgi:Zn-dependent protease with chaperone function
VNALLSRSTYALVALAFLGVVPGAAALVSRGLTWLPLATVAAAAGTLWALWFLRALLPPPRTNPAAVQRLSGHVDAVASMAGIRAPRVIVSRRAVGAGISWCNGQPRITFPDHWMERLNDEELRAYVAHELAHQTQPTYRALLNFNRLSPLVGGAMVGLCFVMLTGSGSEAIPTGLLVIYCALPLVLTAAVILRPLAVRRVLKLVETTADDQAVQWGASASSLAGVLELLESPSMRVPLPLDQRLLHRLLLHFYPRTAGYRAQRLRALTTQGSHLN